MNWDRVRQWDRVRDGMSDMELADARDERWFAREAEREAAREARRAARAKPTAKRAAATKPNAAKKAAAKNGQAKNLKLAEVARRLGVKPAEAQAAVDAQNQAATGLGGLTKVDRVSTAARRLGITGDELRLLRRALAGNVDALTPRERVASLVRTVAGTEVTGPPPPTKSAKPAPARKVITSSSAPAHSKSTAPAAAPSTKRKKTQKRSNVLHPVAKLADGMVYVTTWGNVVHLFHDCHSTRGFRGTNEPDPDLYRVPVNDPSCRGRRVCGTCRNVTFANAKRVEEQLRRFHGKPFDEAEWQRQGWFRPKPSGKPFNRRKG